MSQEQEQFGEFWRYSLELYAREGMSRALLALQDRHGADVNLLLYCCWMAMSGRGRLSAVGLRRADAAIAGWRDDVTLPLREVRRRIKGSPERWTLPGASDVRRRVLETEIASERVTQGILERVETSPGRSEGGPDDARASLLSYLEVIGVEPDELDLADLETIVAIASRDAFR